MILALFTPKRRLNHDTACSTSAAPTAAPAAVPAEPEDPAAALEKQIRALKKKVRQAETLVTKRSEGQKLTEQEEEKVSKIPGW